MRLRWMHARKRMPCNTPFPSPGMRRSATSYYLVREKLGQKIHKRPSPITLDEYLAEREK